MTARATLDALVTEEAFLQQVKDLARLRGWLVFHTRDSRGSERGWPDLVLVRPPQLLLAELKTERGRLSPAQSETIAALRECGLDVVVWRPSQWETIEWSLR